MSIQFPSIEETKLNTILQDLQPELQQVQSDLKSISNKYRKDLQLQVESSINFQNQLVKKYGKLNKVFKKTVQRTNDLNSEVNKKLDHLKNHLVVVQNDGGTDGTPDGADGQDKENELTKLTMDVMGKLWGVIENIEEGVESGYVSFSDLDSVRFPTLKKVLDGNKNDEVTSTEHEYESFQEVNFDDVDEGNDNINKDEDGDVGISDAGNNYEENEADNNYEENDGDENVIRKKISDPKIESLRIDDNDEAIEDEVEADYHSNTPDIHTNTQVSAETSISTPLKSSNPNSEDELASIERLISGYKSKRLRNPSVSAIKPSIPLSSDSTVITTTEPIQVTGHITSLGKINLSNDLKRFI